MSAPAFTPGPWHHAGRAGGWDGVTSDDGIDICHLEYNEPANARLIAAAPDMLAALQAEQAADEAFDAAYEYTHRADAEDWLNDPTGSLHVNAAWQRAHDMRAKATKMRLMAISKALTP